MKSNIQSHNLELIELYLVRPSLLEELNEEFIELGKEISEKYVNIYAPENRCWWTCIKLAKAINKKWRKNLKLAYSHSHYWLEYKGEVICPHYQIIFSEPLSKSEYFEQKVGEYSIQEVLNCIKPLKEGYEERPAISLNKGERWVKIPTVKI